MTGVKIYLTRRERDALDELLSSCDLHYLAETILAKWPRPERQDMTRSWLRIHRKVREARARISP